MRPGSGSRASPSWIKLSGPCSLRPLQLWHELCDLISQNPDKVQSLNVDAIIRGGLTRFTDQLGKLWCSLADYYIRSGHFEKVCGHLDLCWASDKAGHLQHWGTRLSCAVCDACVPPQR